MCRTLVFDDCVKMLHVDFKVVIVKSSIDFNHQCQNIQLVFKCLLYFTQCFNNLFAIYKYILLVWLMKPFCLNGSHLCSLHVCCCPGYTPCVLLPWLHSMCAVALVTLHVCCCPGYIHKKRLLTLSKQAAEQQSHINDTDCGCLIIWIFSS
uniref:Uncharacterized protein n=1 Tax=Gasterosteus aculeatus TaxID=69293 RepID=G3PNS3_GASAC